MLLCLQAAKTTNRPVITVIIGEVQNTGPFQSLKTLTISMMCFGVPADQERLLNLYPWQLCEQMGHLRNDISWSLDK